MGWASRAMGYGIWDQWTSSSAAAAAEELVHWATVNKHHGNMAIPMMLVHHLEGYRVVLLSYVPQSSLQWGIRVLAYSASELRSMPSSLWGVTLERSIYLATGS